jgi:hypothetical protein
MKKLVIVCAVIFMFFNVKIVYSDDLTNKIGNFWKYISGIENDLYNIKDNNSPLYAEITKQIQLLVDENIYVLLSNEIKNSRKNLVITAGGNSQYFELCDRIVSLAPRFKRLNPVSLLPAIEKIEPFIYGDIIFRVEDVRVLPDNLGDNISLLFLLSNDLLMELQADSTGQLYSVYMQVLFMMTQQVLGEKIMAERIVSADISPISTLIPNMPIMDLRKYIK